VVSIDVAPEKLGAYRVRGKLGEGGMATVYVGNGPDGSLRALKVIKVEYAENAEFSAMFLDEGKISSRLSHDNIVKIWTLGREGNRLFMVMDLLRGHSLHALTWAAKERGIAIGPHLAAYIGGCMASALHHAHEATDEAGQPLQIIHRDVNPSNVLVSYDGDVKMIDFGLAKAVNRSSQTAAGILKGKIGYLSPEQVSGKPLDRRSDLFTLGITLWEVALDRRLFKAETKVETLRLIHSAEVLDPRALEPEFPPLFANVIMRLLEKERDDRYPTAKEAGWALREFLRIERPNVDMKAELAALMARVFGDERAQQDAWLEKVANSRSTGPMNTLRPPVMTRGSFESLPPLPGTSDPPPLSSLRSMQPSGSLPSTRPSQFSSPQANAAAPEQPRRGLWLLIFVVVLLASAVAAFTLVAQWLQRSQ